MRDTNWNLFVNINAYGYGMAHGSVMDLWSRPQNSLLLRIGRVLGRGPRGRNVRLHRTSVTHSLPYPAVTPSFRRLLLIKTHAPFRVSGRVGSG